MIGIISYGAYIPLWRLKREAISEGAKGERSVGNFDEDSLTMAVSAAIHSLEGVDRKTVSGLLFASTTFPYKEKQAANIVAAASDLPKEIFTIDVANSLRGGISAFKLAADMVKAEPAKKVVVVASDCRLGLPGSIFEQNCGDGAGAVVIGNKDVAIEIEAYLSAYNQIIDVWRADEDKFICSWEDRFIQDSYIKTVDDTVQAFIKKHKIEPKDISKAIFCAPDMRALSEVAVKLGFNLKTQIQDPLFGVMGNSGTAYSLMLLIAALEDAKAGDRILWTGYGDGCDVYLLKVTEEIERLRGQKGIRRHLESKQYIKDYLTYLEWRRLLSRRGVKLRTEEVSMTALRRDWDEVIRFYGSRCKSCGTIQFPPQRVCTKCHTIGQFERIRLSDQKAKLFTFTVDFVTDPIDKQMSVSVVDFDCGGRAILIMSDQDSKKIRIGMPLEMSFRKLFYNREQGIHNYFWRSIPERIR
jgi:3-hydroxy-3-methylglutaryl CoA synthase